MASGRAINGEANPLGARAAQDPPVTKVATYKVQSLDEVQMPARFYLGTPALNECLKALLNPNKYRDRQTLCHPLHIDTPLLVKKVVMQRPTHRE